jgi:hypothetical protein
MTDTKEYKYVEKCNKFILNGEWYSVKQLSFMISKSIKNLRGDIKQDKKNLYLYVDKNDKKILCNLTYLFTNIIVSDSKYNKYNILNQTLKLHKRQDILELNDYIIKNRKNNKYYNNEMYEKYFSDCENMKDIINNNGDYELCFDSFKEKKKWVMDEFASCEEDDNSYSVNYIDTTGKNNMNDTDRINRVFTGKFYWKCVEKEVIKFFKELVDNSNKRKQDGLFNKKRCVVCNIFKDNDNYTEEQFKIICNDCSVIKRKKEMEEDSKLCDMCKDCKKPIKKNKILCVECFKKED